MTKQEIREGNRAIWAFMGETSVPEIELLKYDLSWSCLMPACKKFDNLTDEIPADDYWMYEQCCDAIDIAVTSYEIERAFKKLVEGIIWYNTTKKDSKV